MSACAGRCRFVDLPPIIQRPSLMQKSIFRHLYVQVLVGVLLGAVIGMLGSSTFSGSQIIDLSSLVARLRQPSDTDGVSRYLASQLSPETKTLLLGYTGGPDADLRQAL